MSKALELQGLSFGRLLVVKLDSIKIFSSKNRATIWECRCNCGNTINVIGSHLISGHTESCGCISKELCVDMRKKLKKGRGPSNGDSNAYGAYRRRAKQNNTRFDLTKEQFLNISSQRCHYCNGEPNNLSKGRYGGNDYRYSGLDRVNNDEGYCIQNVVPCCIFCNTIKGAHLTSNETKILILKLKQLRSMPENQGFKHKLKIGK